MRLHRVKLLNFRQHADSEIVLGSGITGIIGPNGAGKTTLLEAIAWAFYGNPAARGSRESIRWNRAQARSPVRVEVDFALGAHEYRVVRGLYNAELYQDRFDAPVANSQQEVTLRVERLLGMTRGEFFNTYFTGQKELAVMSAMGPTDRARFLSRILGYEKLRHVQDRLRDARTGLRGELAGLLQGLTDPEVLEREREEAGKQLAEAKRALQRLTNTRAKAVRTLEAEKPAWQHMVECRDRALSLNGERQIAVRDVKEARREFERLDRELAEALTARSRLDALQDQLCRVAPLRDELERLEQQGRLAGRRRSLVGQRSEVDGQRARLEERLGQIGAVAAELAAAKQGYEDARGRLRQAEEDLEKARTGWVRDRQDAETKRLTLRDQYKEIHEHRQSIVEAGADGRCPTCTRPLGEEFETVLGTLSRQLEQIEVQGKFFKQRVDQLASPPSEVEAAEQAWQEAGHAVERAREGLTAAETRVRDREALARDVAAAAVRRGELDREIAELPERYDQERHDAVRAELKELEPVVTSAAELRVKATRAELLVGEAETAEKDLSDKEERVAQLERAVADLGFSEDAYVAAHKRFEVAEEAVREVDLALASGRGDLKAAETALETAERRLRDRAERAARADTLKRDLRLHDELDRALQDLRAELNAQMRPELSERASAFLADLTDGRYAELELDEQYQILVLEDGVTKPVISGGEEDVANLVLRLAISQMVAERAGLPLSLLVLDEIFGSLDEQRRHNVVALLRHLADRFPQVILITHIESIRDGVDRVIRVELDPTRGAAVVADDPGVAGDEDVAA
jgi:exonuclease SbcC